LGYWKNYSIINNLHHDTWNIILIEGGIPHAVLTVLNKTSKDDASVFFYGYVGCTNDHDSGGVNLYLRPKTANEININLTRFCVFTSGYL
jgi:hypothetical protein